MDTSTAFIFLLIVLLRQVYGEVAQRASINHLYSSTDPRSCLTEPEVQSTKPELRLEVLPGIGFDNLRNLNAGQVCMWTYNDCKTTEDGHYLIPDSVLVLPVKASSLETFADVFQHWSSYNSATSKTINADADGNIGLFSISGKFSDEFEDVKTHQITDNAFTTRVQIRHVFYTAKIEPDTPLHPSFKNRLMNIAAHLQNNNTAVARYLSQILVRDYGTHVVTSVDAGAAFVKEDQVKNTFLKNADNSKHKISVSASASFGSYVQFNAGYSSKDTDSLQKQYIGNRTWSRIRTIGGTSFQSNFTLSKWQEELRNDLVAIDRAGDPLHFFVTTSTLPELPDPTITDLAELIKTSTELYYKFNTHAGCTKQGLPNFNFQANLDDGSCKPPATNLTFGGVYQTCRDIKTSAGSLCHELAQKNPRTGSFSCTPDYLHVRLHTGTSKKTITRWVCVEKCHGCGLFWRSTCCNHDCTERRHSSSATYSAYWCAALSKVHEHSGYLFGGLYTSKIANPVTGTKSCPTNFFQLRLGTDLHVCVSDDYELGRAYSLPFAGFFSCVSGNPLSTIRSGSPKDPPPLTNIGTQESKRSPLEQVIMDAGPTVWPKSCPQGFSRHLAVIADRGCEINYCVQLGSLSDQALPKIRRPPFSSQPKDNPESTNTIRVYGVAGKIWALNISSGSWVRVDIINDQSMSSVSSEYREVSDTGNTISPGGAAGIAVATTVVCGIILWVIVVRVRAKRARNRGSENASPEERVISYSSIN